MPSELSFKARRCCFDRVAFNSSNDGLGIDMFVQVYLFKTNARPIPLILINPDAGMILLKHVTQKQVLWIQHLQTEVHDPNSCVGLQHQC